MAEDQVRRCRPVRHHRLRDLTPGTIEAVTVAEVLGDKLMSAGAVQFGVGRRLREALDVIRLKPRPGSRRVPVWPVLTAEIK